MTVHASNPCWVNQEHTAIDLDLKLPGGEQFRFTASPLDSEAHGRVLWEAAVAGQFGEIAPYVATVFEPPEGSQIEIVESRLTMVSRMIAPLEDARELGMATEKELERLMTLKRYRVELNRLPQAPNWPSIAIPDVPKE